MDNHGPGPPRGHRNSGARINEDLTARRTILLLSTLKAYPELAHVLMFGDSGKFGGAEGDRTPDLMTASHALSQLSYGPMLRG